MLDYYTLQKTLETLSNDEHKYIAQDIATLCRQGILTPYFSYNRYIAHTTPIMDTRTGKDYEGFEPATMKLFNEGYLTNRKLLDLLDGYSDSVAIGHARDEMGYECELYYNAINIYRYFNDENYSPYSDNDVLTVTKEHLSFKREQVQSYIASRQNNEQQRIAELESELSDNTAKDYQITIGLLLDLLLNKSTGFDNNGKDLPPPFPSQAKIIEYINEQGLAGHRYKKVERRFTDAKKALIDKRKE